jgi:hypothetical protein
VVLVHVFGVQVGHDVGRFRGCQEGDACSVAQEAEIAVVCYDVDGRVPGYTGGRGLAGTCVVYGTDVTSIEPDAWAALE